MPIFLIAWPVVGEAATFCVAPEMTMEGEIGIEVPPDATSAVTTNCCRDPVSALLSGCTRLQPTKLMMSPLRRVFAEPLVTVTAAPA